MASRPESGGGWGQGGRRETGEKAGAASEPSNAGDLDLGGGFDSKNVEKTQNSDRYGKQS